MAYCTRLVIDTKRSEKKNNKKKKKKKGGILRESKRLTKRAKNERRDNAKELHNK